MIASICGRVAGVSPDGAVIEIGGIGLSVQCAPDTIAGLRSGEVARLATSLVVREDSLTLYGFSSDDERSLFELLQTASGVGPRLAQAVLAVLKPTEVRRAVATEDLTTLTRVPGIGKKGAERLVLELRDRLGSIGTSPSRAGGPTVADQPWREQVRQALVGLGWSAREAEEGVSAVVAEAAGGAAEADVAGGADVADVAALLKSAIRVLGRP
ncbi:MAG: Holliday junction branch migration protein RuvA [Actinomycetota bacterium]|nr:Holliday junction branch migration protein RuvA [Actinomycetota bacterium]